MAKAASSYSSITRGVSEQVPQDRLAGQNWEQVNMVSDPRRGVARRHGSVTMDEKVLGIAPLTASQHEYLRNYREYSFFLDGTEYSLVYQGDERPASDPLPFCFCHNKMTGKFLSVQISESTPGALDPWRFGGLSAVTTVGRYVVMASNRIGPGHSSVDQFAAHSQQAVAWVRGGAYSRTFSLTLKRADDGQVVTVSYTTMASSYPALLDTSDIVQEGNPNYSKQVNDRVNAYNSASNKWIGDAQASVQPQNIAAQLASQLGAKGFVNYGLTGGSIILANVAELSVNDSGDGSLFRAVHNEVDDPAKLSTIHFAGKVVKVKPKGTDDAYYMVAKTDSGSSGTVTWEEGAAQIVTPGKVFALATISADGKTLVMADTPAQLAAATGTPVPGYSASRVGDLTSKGAVPYFFGRRITLLTVFMDRLVVVANGVVFMSRAGDYFNWFRNSMLRQDADDPIEAYALGAEDDIISRSVTYNKDLFMFGERNQYSISGRIALTPQSIAISTAASEKDSVSGQPIVVGNLLFYGKYEAAPNQDGPSPYSGSVSQFQLGLFEGSPETYLVSQQLDKYIRGRPTQFTALPSPHSVFVRTDGYDFGLYVYRFIDQPGSQSRVFDSWSRWLWSPAVGRIIGITIYKATLFVYTIRENARGPWVACEQFVMDSELSVRPYLDAQRSPADYAQGGGFFEAADTSVLGDVHVAASQGSDAAFLGAAIQDFAGFYADELQSGARPGAVGAGYEGSLQITSPFVRDQNDRALVNGRLVVNRYTLSVTRTSGMDAYRTDAGGASRVFGFNGRRVGLSNNQVGRQPVTTATVDVPCGRANTEHRMEFRTRSWLPLTISAIEWVGQIFNNTRRV
ncbi:phage tail protein [Achromobacter mucicolens]|uniref:phage nozzle protein n=1 Tax=Achromobacter mucicolens TaxID=1389922 RepID=UPI002FE25B42